MFARRFHTLVARVAVESPMLADTSRTLATGPSWGSVSFNSAFEGTRLFKENTGSREESLTSNDHSEVVPG